jgi:hypothetical protein
MSWNNYTEKKPRLNRNIVIYVNFMDDQDYSTDIINSNVLYDYAIYNPVINLYWIYIPEIER